MSAHDTRRQDARYLGIDGGGTATRAVVVDAGGAVRGRGTASGANQAVIGRDAAAEAVRTAAQAALAEAGAALPVRAAWVGLAGVDTPDGAEALRPALAALAGDLRITNDAELLLGALPGVIGVAVIAGTGSVVLGRNAAGQTARAGGWGHIFGDEGSGYAIGAAALRAVARSADGRGEPTALTPALLHTLGVATPAALIARVYQGCDKPAIARLASLVVEAAEAGDSVAQTILRQAAGELADQTCAVMRTLGLAVPADGSGQSEATRPVSGDHRPAAAGVHQTRAAGVHRTQAAGVHRTRAAGVHQTRAAGVHRTPLPLALGGGLLMEAPAYRALLLEALGGESVCAPVVPVRDAALVAARSLAAGEG